MYTPIALDNKISTKIYTHGADVDGVSCAILAKLCFPNVDYDLLANPEELNKKLVEDIYSHKLDKYASIFITDLPIFKKSLEAISANPTLSKKIVIFDHHLKSIDEGAENYDFCNVEVKLNERYTCATELFYKWLYMKRFITEIDLVYDYVEHVRENDTWEWKNHSAFGVFSHRLSYLLDELGADEYIKVFYNKFLFDVFLGFSKEEERIINQHEEKILAELRKSSNTIEYFVDKEGNKVAAMFAPYFIRNEISDYLRNIQKNISYVIIVSKDVGKYGQKSYRKVDGECDLNKIASMMNGGGHKNSARVLISQSQRQKMDSFESQKQALQYIINQKYIEETDQL
ncbi:MAG: hypothetical protein IKI57_07170 [Clostridia bacterium]|nr:hypothetical protein [Clostridia bacterium]